MITSIKPILLCPLMKNIDWQEILIGGTNNNRMVLLTESGLIYTGETVYHGDDGFLPEAILGLETLMPSRFRTTHWYLYAFSTQAICLASYEGGKPQYLLYDKVKRNWELITDRENDRLKEFEEQAESETECFTPIRWDLD